MRRGQPTSKSSVSTVSRPSHASRRPCSADGVALIAGHETRAQHDTRGTSGERGERRRRIGKFRPRRAVAATPPGGPRPEGGTSRRRSGRGRRPRRLARSARRRPRLPPPWPHPPRRPVRATRAADAGLAHQIGTESERERHHGTLSSTTSARRSSCAKSSTRFTQNGRSVTRAIERICSRSSGGSVHDAPSVPRPPACETAAASCAAAPPRAAPASAEIRSPARSQHGAYPTLPRWSARSARRPRAACHAPIRSRRTTPLARTAPHRRRMLARLSECAQVEISLPR